MNSGSHADRPVRQRPRLTTVCGLLALVMILVAGALGAWGYSSAETLGLAAGLLAAIICFACSLVGLVIVGRMAGSPQAINGIMGSILLDMFPPMGLGLVVKEQWPALDAAGFFGMLLAAFLVFLVTKTLLLVWLIGPSRAVAKAS